MPFIFSPSSNENLYHLFKKGFCCEIDENCGETEPYITDMENCLTFGHEYIDYDHNGTYFDSGSHARKIVYHEQEEKKKKERRRRKKKEEEEIE